MAVTIKDVSKLANVAPSTVSRVIADSPRISEDTKRRVRDAMKELGYHPNLNARSLANKSSQAFGVIIPRSTDKAFQNPFFPEVVRGISKVAHEKEFALYISTGATERDIYEEVVRMVQGRRVDGIILLYSSIDNKIMSYLHKQKFPFTIIGKPAKNMDNITHVDNDNIMASKDVTNHLIQLGHERIAFVGGNINLVVTIDRLLGYKEALQNAGLTYRDEYIVHEEFLQEGGQEAISKLLSLKEPPTAIIAADDIMAFGMLKTLDEIGISVPDDLSIVSFNNIMLSEVSRPPLSTVDINIYQLGYQAAKCLIEKIENPEEPAKRIILPYKIIKRESCKEYK
ncbi:LacI family transcriptional regulator [Lottiidibacillus patelloidae]|uniref:LacI family transcriptional regulator n=1 Tax=Lottiidibacillus patelloidae TaxID=2670334 RepID=A0A263BRJ9_9BACI|nr:LacI family DNA-binding transcriptional regulator [Lottiidibacillus patelloidae]OZM56333.1 LacI family transcriptional regulator [Lottiidibacillus patelloidae]